MSSRLLRKAPARTPAVVPTDQAYWDQVVLIADRLYYVLNCKDGVLELIAMKMIDNNRDANDWRLVKIYCDDPITRTTTDDSVTRRTTEGVEVLEPDPTREHHAVYVRVDRRDNLEECEWYVHPVIAAQVRTPRLKQTAPRVVRNTRLLPMKEMRDGVIVTVFPDGRVVPSNVSSV